MPRNKIEEKKHVNSLMDGKIDKMLESGGADYCSNEIVDNEKFSFTMIEQYGGEGEGEEYWAVWKLIDKENNEEFYIRFNASYDSWNGTEWEDWEVVVPKEVKVTKYFTKEYSPAHDLPF